jgi:hypothetical protein
MLQFERHLLAFKALSHSENEFFRSFGLDPRWELNVVDQKLFLSKAKVVTVFIF